MTLQPKPYSDLSSPVTAAIPAAGTSARPFTEPLRELSALALLVANVAFLCLGASGLFVVVDRWATDFGLRSAAEFAAFVGPASLGLPMAAMLLATHVTPILGRARLITLIVLVEYGVSALLGLVTFLGAFADNLSSVRATLEGLLERSVWLTLLVLAIIVVVRVWLGMFPARGRAATYAGYPHATYGTPYPGQPLYAQSAFQAGSPWSGAPMSGAPMTGAPMTGAPMMGAPTGPARAASHAGPAQAGVNQAGVNHAGVNQASPVSGGVASGGTVSGGMAGVDAGTTYGGSVPAARPAGLAAPQPPTSENGWPLVPPPPMPGPLVLDADPTMRIVVPSQVWFDPSGDATTVVPPPDLFEPPAQQPER